MKLLDTNVLSALMRREPDARVVAWLDAQEPETVWTTTITVFEARCGLALLSEGRRRQALLAALEALLEDDLRWRVLPLDARAATLAAELAARRRRQGRPVDLRDTLIAGIALAHRATIVTRNRRHFADLEVDVVDPWAAD
ncbi:Toxin FitB [Tepidimonas sediminis]|uniref:Ribonuclease VapC n=1 Tax=Tepidimonas sediminis TaxID=2588941 RepID=A0A554WQN6_9BURK|nr:PIN domain-containing protein [Tepidimonas sediminis]TSE25887.1 Toxin FitB [Tepidimonas sediminis]